MNRLSDAAGRREETERSTDSATGPAARSKALALELRGLTKRYRDSTALKGIDLAVVSGEFVTILGPSGSGKTTCLRLIAGFDTPTSGHILIDGTDVSNSRPAERNIGMVFQNYALFPHMTVESNIAYGLRRRRWSREAIPKRVSEVLQLVRLGGLGKRLPRELSGGQQQRVALARALAPGPKILLMDEPLGALDRQLRIEMQEEIRRIHREVGATIVHVTHDQEEALSMSDRLAIMWHGDLVAYDTPPALYERPESALVAKFLSNANLFDIDHITSTQSGGIEVSWLGSVVAMPGRITDQARSTLLAIKPESLTTIPMPNAFRVRAEIVDIEFLGEAVKVTCKTETREVIVANLRKADVSLANLDQTIELFVAGEDCALVADDRAGD